MVKNIILFADNDEEPRITWGRILTNAGYDVRLASNPQEARDVLQHVGVDAAVLDLRLVDDKDENDISGLLLAKERTFHHTPKIILTAFETGYRNLREVLGPIIDDLPPAVAFVHKNEGPHALLEVIRNTLQMWPHLRLSTIKVSEQIKSDHQEAQQQARLNYRAAFVLSILGCIIIFAGIGLAWLNQLAIGIVGTTGGIIAEILSYLFFSRVNLANERMDNYHRELLQTYWLEFLLSASDNLPSQERVACIERTITIASDNWLSHSSGFNTSLRTTEETKKGNKQ